MDPRTHITFFTRKPLHTQERAVGIRRCIDHARLKVLVIIEKFKKEKKKTKKKKKEEISEAEDIHDHYSAKTVMLFYHDRRHALCLIT